MQLGSNPVATAIQWLNTLMMQTINIPEFEGEPGMLIDFLERGTCIMNQVTGSGLDEGSARTVRQMLIGRISVVVRRELGINVAGQWDEVVKRLKEVYDGAQKFYQRQVVSLILTGRNKGESPGAYAQSMEAQVRVLCDRILETEEDKLKAQHAIELVKSLIVERIKREMPERIKKALKPVGAPLRLDEAIDVIREEDEDFMESRKVEEGWTRVSHQRQKKETPRREYRETPRREYKEKGEYRPQTNRPKWKRKPDNRPRESRDHQHLDGRRCYQCRERGHIARFCPYIRGSSGFRNRPEPMEVNFGDLVRQYDERRRKYVWTERGESGSSTEEEERRETSSGGESSSSKERKKMKPTLKTGLIKVGREYTDNELKERIE
ncbi:hypothetical protein AAG570_013270 [Ranatra chinensis]|uniref:CCHC-type domain-containing protein n=1 Tax=Ranatra chinensis TaxID=642074 RepID=A0ABD0YSR3_9HEMI